MKKISLKNILKKTFSNKVKKVKKVKKIKKIKKIKIKKVVKNLIKKNPKLKKEIKSNIKEDVKNDEFFFKYSPFKKEASINKKNIVNDTPFEKLKEINFK